jgi:hypothetical protein
LIGVRNWKATDPSKAATITIPIANRRIDAIKKIQLVTVYE